MTILVVDDEAVYARFMAQLLESEGYTTAVAHSAAAARLEMHRLYPELVLMDLHLPDGNGAELMQELQPDYPDTAFIIVTAHGSIRSAVEATRSGASDYLTKPPDADEVVRAIRRVQSQRRLGDQLRALREGHGPVDRTSERRLEGFPSAAMREAMALARRAAQQDGIVLLQGESGTGKDVLAHWLHRHSRRAEGPLFTINCAALPPELAESELFGHEPGAFTGTRRRKRGLVELAEQGTLLLNEVGELSATMQAKLLTFLDTKSFVRVGGERSIEVDTRIIAATNRDLSHDVADGRFRLDLFYRLNVFPIQLPPLRERADDIPWLVDDIIQRLVRSMGLTRRPEVRSDALRSLVTYAWPGNVRELVNVLERALILCDEGVLRARVLKLGVESTTWELRVPFPSGETLHEVTGHVARELLHEALRRAGGSKQKAAKLLGISRHALAYQLKSLGVDA